MKVLVVEDHDDTRYLVMMLIRMAGYAPLEARNGIEAIQLATSELPDLILMDLNLPALDGWQATRLITSSKTTSHIPIVTLSAMCHDSWKAEALAAGARECLDKPVDLLVVNNLLRRYQSHSH